MIVIDYKPSDEDIRQDLSKYPEAQEEPVIDYNHCYFMCPCGQMYVYEETTCHCGEVVAYKPFTV